MGRQFVARPLPFVRRRRKSCCKSENLATLLTHWLTQWKGDALASKKAKWLTMTESHWTTQFGSAAEFNAHHCKSVHFSFWISGCLCCIGDLNGRLKMKTPIEGRTMSIGQFHLRELAPACSRRIGLDGDWADAVNALRPENEAGKLSKNGVDPIQDSVAALISLVSIAISFFWNRVVKNDLREINTCYQAPS